LAYRRLGLLRYYAFVCILPEKAIPEMTYCVSGGTLNPTHSLTHCALLVVESISNLTQGHKILSW